LVAQEKENKLCDLIGGFGIEDAILAEAREQSEKDRERQPKATGSGKTAIRTYLRDKNAH